MEKRGYRTWRRPFRLQLSVSAAAGFDAPASRGWCRSEGGERFEWETEQMYCRTHWLLVHGQDRLPERAGREERR